MMGSLVYASGSAALSEIFGELRISPALSAPAAQRPDPAFRSHTSQASLSLTQKVFAHLHVFPELSAHFLFSLSPPYFYLAQLTYSSFYSMTLLALCPGSSYFIILSLETQK